MMDTLNFLQRVLPSSGFYVTAVINTGEGARHGFFSTVEDLTRAVTASDKRGNNTYYAISAFAEKGRRTQDNARAVKVLALDVDCGPNKPYATKGDGVAALAKFLKDTRLPRPMIVDSGNGLHVYWCLTEEVPLEQWKPVALALKAACQDREFHIDPAVPGDSARVLRPVGTTNPKSSTQVTLLADAPDYDLSTITAALAPFAARTKLGVPSVTPATVQHTSTSTLTSALQVKQDFPPAIAGVVYAKCQQINWAVKNQAEVPEPLWYDLIGVAAHCTEPEATAIAWSDQHPDFNAQVTLHKLEHWRNSATGPTTCSKFEADRPGGCKGCKFRDKIGSPARLGVQYQEVKPSTDVPAFVSTDVPLPRPFKRTVDGLKAVIDDTDIDVCKFDIYPVAYGKDEGLGYETVRYCWKRPHSGWTELSLRQAYLTVPRIKDFTTEIADQGIVLAGVRQTEYFQLMLRSYMDELRQKRAMTNLYSTMGWKDNFSQFVIGDTILRRTEDGTVTSEDVTLSAGSARLGHELYGTAGELSEWIDFTRLIDRTGLHAHSFALGVGLSSALYAFTGLKGLTVSLYGPTGGGKTLAQYWVQSIYGNPDKLHFAAKFTQNSLFSRMGLYCHMPMTIDEVTMMDDKEVGDFAYWVSQGRDKARMTRNAEERDARTWAMPVVVSTNKSMQSKLIASGLDTDAQMARILEVSVPPHPMFTKDSMAGRRIYQFLMSNYGHVGRAFVSKLLELGPDGCKAAIAEATATFNKRYQCKFAGEERFWEQAIIMADLASTMAKDWGLIQHDPRPGVEWTLAQVGAIRRTVQESKLDAFDMLSDYLNDCADTAVTVMHTGTQKPTVDFSRMPRNDIRVRFDVYRKSASEAFNYGTVFLDRAHFRRWLSQRGADYKTFIQELTEESAIATPSSKKAYLGKDTPAKLGQVYVIGVNLNHPRLQGILDEADQSYENMAFGQLKAV
jgi:hypothetical protein